MMKVLIPAALIGAVLLLPNDPSTESWAQPDGGRERRRADRAERYDVAMVSLGNRRWGAVRYDTATGESWRMMEGAWVPIEEVSPPEERRATYVVKAVQTATGRFAAVRLNPATGQSWHLNEGLWLPIAEP